MNGSHPNVPPFAELFTALACCRRGLLLTYLILLLSFCALLSLKGWFALPDLLGHAFGVTAWNSDAKRSLIQGPVFFLAVLALQALFLWVWGRVKGDQNPTTFLRLLAPILLTTAFLGLALVAILASCSELVELWTISGNPDEAMGAFSENHPYVFWVVATIIVCSLGVVLYRLVRHKSRCQALWRLASVVFLTALAGFSLALPIELAVRGHKEDRFLVELTGSLLALVFCFVPLLLWVVGILIYLLPSRAARAQDASY